MNRNHRTTAIHEAGHAVIGRVLGLICGSITINRNVAEGEEGHAIIADPYVIWGAWEKRGKFRVLDSVFRGRIMHTMAGEEAVRLILSDQHTSGDGEDRFQIALMLQAITGPSMSEDALDALEVRLRRMTVMLVRRHRKKIVAVAKALLSQRGPLRGTLTGNQIDTILCSRTDW